MFHKFLRTLVIVLILGVGIGIGSQLTLRDQLTAKDADKPKAKQLPSVKMGVVNIASVLREYRRANHDGLAISKRRQDYVALVKPMREKLAELSNDLKNAKTDEEKSRLKVSAAEVNRHIEEMDRKAQDELSVMSDRVIVDVYTDIRVVIAEVAKERGADIIAAHPDASDEKDHLKPAIAQLKLQTPAMTPFFINPEMDLTSEIIDRLNKKYPAEKVKAP